MAKLIFSYATGQASTHSALPFLLNSIVQSQTVPSSTFSKSIKHLLGLYISTPFLAWRKLPPLRATGFHRSSCGWEGVSFGPSLRLKYPTLHFGIPVSRSTDQCHRAGFVSLITYVADCALFSCQGS